MTQVIAIGERALIKMLDALGQERVVHAHWADPNSEGHRIALTNAARFQTLSLLIEEHLCVPPTHVDSVLLALANARNRVLDQVEHPGIDRQIKEQCLAMIISPKGDDPNAELRSEMCC